jgi:dipeptidase
MHAGWGPIRGSQTAGSMVSVLKKGEKPVHWVTGTAAPCTSIFKPVWLDAGMPHTGSRPSGVYDRAALYWRHETLHREVLRNYAQSIRLIRLDQKLIEEEFIAEVERYRNASPNHRREISETAFARAAETENKWHEAVTSRSTNNKNSLLYGIAWRKFNREANLE